MKVDGSCHCGQITFEAEIDPDGARICHCTDCQTLTGSAYRINVQTPAASFVLRSGTPKIYIKLAESGNKRAHAFCANCGTPIYATEPDEPRGLQHPCRYLEAARRVIANPANLVSLRAALGRRHSRPPAHRATVNATSVRKYSLEVSDTVDCLTVVSKIQRASDRHRAARE
jgi:hypothetical protein